MENKTNWRSLYRNILSYFGTLIMGVSFLLILLLLLLSLGLKRPGPYMGIFTYLIFPFFMTLGFLIFLYGIVRESRRRRRLGTKEIFPYPVLNLNEPHQRKRLALVIMGGSLLAILLAFLGHNAYLFTDSVTFCGRVCHTVMKPEYTTYLNGPHARVACVECHVGAGVSWYVKSKISGVPQVFATILNTYPRPLPAPLKSMRPAAETCNECHWPQKFYGAELLQIPYFRHDKNNTAQQLSILVRTGGGTPELGENAGIHWHMIIENKIYFKALDQRLQIIPWVRVVLPDGKETVYEDSTLSIPQEELEALPVHLMDCMHCHNRPSHNFLPPETAVDRAMDGEQISRKLPWIKKLAVEALLRRYKTREEAHEAIRKGIEAFYAKDYPKVLNTQKTEVDQAIRTITSIFDRSFFFEMKVNWATYSNDIGHRNWPGCFRCHNDRHRTRSGKVLTSQCIVCHTMPQRGPLMPLGATAPASKEPWHIWVLKGEHEKVLCSNCHQAGHLLSRDCASCHKISAEAPMMSMSCNRCHQKEGERQPLVNCSSCHPHPEGLHGLSEHSDAPCVTCHVPHTWTVTSRETCLSCHEEKGNHYSSHFCGQCHLFTKT